MVAHNEPGIRVWTPEQLPQVVRKALELRRKGYSYSDIADTLGVSLGTAHKYVNQELEKMARLRAAEAGQVLELELARLDRLIQAVADKAEAGSLEHVDTFIRLCERRAKLLGLNAASMHKVEVDDKRALPDVEVYKKTRALLERLAAAGHPVDKRLLERSPFDAVLEGQVVENAVKDVARPVFPAPQSAENGDPGTSSEPKSDEFGDKNASNDEPGHQET